MKRFLGNFWAGLLLCGLLAVLALPLKVAEAASAGGTGAAEIQEKINLE